MSLIVNHNMMAMNAARHLSATYSRLGKSVERLSSGLRVNSAADDAAGLAIRELMRADISVLSQGIRNASDAISLIQTAEGAMSVIDEKLIRMKELAEQAATGTYTTSQREIINSEYQAMAKEIDRIANATDFNGVKILDGSLETGHNGSGMKIHFGTGNDSAEDYYYIGIGDMRATEATGLRVGNSDPNDIFTTTALNQTTPGGLLAGTGGTTTGVFGIQTTTDGGTTWSTYGWVTIDQDDTLADIAYEIGQGPQYTTTLTVGATTTTDLDDSSLTINGHVFTFDTGVAVANSTTHGSATTIGLSGATSGATTLGIAIARAINDLIDNGNSTANVIANATGNGTTIVLYHEDFGTPTGTTDLGMSFGGGTTLGLTSTTWGSRDLLNNVGGYSVLDSANTYELQLRTSLTGDNNQLRVITTTGNAFNDTGSGMTTVAVGGSTLYSGWAGADSQVTTFALVDSASEWEQTQNGEGTTSWDGADIRTQSAAQLALAALDDAITNKDIARANLGAIQNRLENTITNLQIQAENLQAAESRISDADVAWEMTEFTKNNIMAQAAVSMLAQANSLPQLALSLLGS